MARKKKTPAVDGVWVTDSCSCGEAISMYLVPGRRFAECAAIEYSCKCAHIAEHEHAPYEEALCEDVEFLMRGGYGAGDQGFDTLLSEYVEYLSGGATIPILAGPLEVFAPVEQVVPILEVPESVPGYFNGTHFVPIVREHDGRFAPVIQVGR